MWLLSLVLSCSPGAAGAPPEVPVAQTCLTTWTRDSSTSVLSEQRASGAERWFDFASAYPAAEITAGMRPVKVTERFAVDGRPVLWFAEDLQRAVVDRAVAGDLTVVDATGIGAGQEREVGRFGDAARRALGDRGVVEFLVVADAIRVYAHVEGHACLVEESAEGGAYRARFTGEHVYFTNDENHAPLAFEVTLGADGVVRVRGG